MPATTHRLKHFDKKELRRLMDSNSYNAQVLGVELGMSASAVSNWLNGHGRPNGDTLPKLAKLLNVTPGQLSRDFATPIGGKGLVPGKAATTNGKLTTLVEEARAQAGRELFDDVEDPTLAAKLGAVLAHLNAAGKLLR